MGIGYSASALHQIYYGEAVDDEPLEAPPERPSSLRALVGDRISTVSMRLRSSGIKDIEAWRDQFSARFADQLGDPLTWNEASEFEVSEDVAPSADVALRYVAALIDQDGEDAVAALVGADKPPASEIGRRLDRYDSLETPAIFPQLLKVNLYWLPFERDIVIAGQDWLGATETFGSTFRLAEQLKAVQATILKADPAACEWTAERETPDKVLWAAWQASDTITNLCAAAIGEQLPLWTTG